LADRVPELVRVADRHRQSGPAAVLRIHLRPAQLRERPSAERREWHGLRAARSPFHNPRSWERGGGAGMWRSCSGRRGASPSPLGISGTRCGCPRETSSPTACGSRGPQPPRLADSQRSVRQREPGGGMGRARTMDHPAPGSTSTWPGPQPVERGAPPPGSGVHDALSRGRAGRVPHAARSRVPDAGIRGAYGAPRRWLRRSRSVENCRKASGPPRGRGRPPWTT
jgi:hypothetical protein